MSESEAIRRLRVAQTKVAELVAEERSGKLVSRDEVAAAQFAIERQRRDAMINLGERISATLAAEMKAAMIAAGLPVEKADALDAGRVHAILMSEIRKGLEEYADSLLN